MEMPQPPALHSTVEHLTAAACLEMIEREVVTRGLVLTGVFRNELQAAMMESPTPDAVLRLGLAIYGQAIQSGDTSACVEILSDALEGTRRCVERTVKYGVVRLAQ